jgi:hypothetical protein
LTLADEVVTYLTRVDGHDHVAIFRGRHIEIA